MKQQSSRSPSSRRSFHRALGAALLLGGAACGSDGDPLDPLEGPGDGDPADPGDPGDPLSSGECGGTPLFSARSYGTDGDLIRRIVVDTANGDVLFSVLNELYVLAAGSGEPEKLADRPDGAQSLRASFMLQDGRLLLPAIGSQPVDGRLPILYSMPRAGGAAEVVASMAVAEALGTIHELIAISLVGDDLVWLDRRLVREDPSSIASPLVSTFYARRTSLASPGEPVLLHESATELTHPVVANGRVYIDEYLGETISEGSQQRIISLADGGVEPQTSEERYGGSVIAADDQSLLINVGDFTDLENMGVFRVAPDGSGRERLMEFPVLQTGLGSFENIAVEAGQWAYVDYDATANVSPIRVYSVGAAPRTIGCVDGDYSVHHIALGDGEVFVSVFDDAGFDAWIERFPL